MILISVNNVIHLGTVNGKFHVVGRTLNVNQCSGCKLEASSRRLA